MSLLGDAIANLFCGHGEHGDYVVGSLSNGGFVQASADTSGDGVLEVKFQSDISDDMGFKPNEYGTYARDVHCRSEQDARDVAVVASSLAGNQVTHVEVGWR